MNRKNSLPVIPNSEFFKNLGEIGLVSKKDIYKLEKKFHRNTLSALLFLIKQLPSKKDFLCRLWADSIGVAYIELEKTILQQDIVHKIPEEIAQKYNVIPIYHLGENITIATSDPTNQDLGHQLENAVGIPVSLVFSLPEEIDQAIQKAYHSDENLKKFISKISSSTLFQTNEILTYEKLQEAAGNQAIVELPICIILFGLKENATDIHIEPGPEIVRIRFRIDGYLIERMQLELSLHTSLISRLKTMATINEQDKNNPQKGRILFPLPGRKAELFFSTISTSYGEKATLKILSQTNLKDPKSLHQIHLSKNNFDKITQALQNPYGIILVVGNEGSEKSSLIYSALKHILRPEISITSVEDPVKYRLEGINQVRTNISDGTDPVLALQWCLLQDNQVLAIDEIRNKDEMLILLEAALTGHFILAGIKANTTIDAIHRLGLMGLDLHNVLPALICIFAQCQVRKLCPQCKEKHQLSREQISLYFETDGKANVCMYRPKGCYACHGTGFSGRIALHEALVLNNKIKSLIPLVKSPMVFDQLTKEAGFQNMRYDGMKKALRGLTTIDEVYRATIA